MNIFPKIEKITRDATLVHFFLMFGYKLFSFYFPLFLVAKNFSIMQVGYTNFLIYLPIALFAPIAGFLNHRINPAILTAVGIFGYAVYSLGMISFPNLFVFYALQVVLGISASLFFVSSRAILMGSRMESYDRSFAWFYSAPSYADAIAPAVGAFFIWKFDFAGVFIFAMIIQLFTAAFCFIKLRAQSSHLTEYISIKDSAKNYLKALGSLKGRQMSPFIITSFLVLILAGFNNTFFVLFLNNLGWTQNSILIFNSVLSLVFLPVSFWVIKRVGRAKSEANVSRGVQITGIFSALMGVFSGILNFYLVFFIMMGKYVGSLISNSGRSGLMSTKLKEIPEESAAVDTVFSPLATAAGALLGGWVIGPLGYPVIFIAFGILMFFSGIFARIFSVAKRENLS